jgi:hypothetical protein
MADMNGVSNAAVCKCIPKASGAAGLGLLIKIHEPKYWASRSKLKPQDSREHNKYVFNIFVSLNVDYLVPMIS